MQFEAAAGTWRRAARAVVPYALCLLALAAYAWAVEARTLRLEWTQLLTEVPLLAYAYALLRAPLRKRWWRSLVAAWPLAWIYLVHDEYYVRWGDVPSFSDVAMLSDLFEVVGPLRGALIVIVLLAPLLAWLAALDLSHTAARRRTAWLAAPLLLATAVLWSAPRRSYAALDALTEDAQWSDRRTAEHWGRLYTSIFRHVRRGSFAEGLSGFTPLARSPLRVAPAALGQLDHRNVHIVVMESFVDLRLLRDARFSDAPFAPALAAWIDPFISTSVSPVFGGETARAEFEVLCGVPSLRLYGLEFLGFSGARTYCLPSILREAGYHTLLTFPHGPVFFNTRHAYPGLGFEQLIYGDRFAKPGEESIAMGDQDYVEDGDLFPQNLTKVRALVARGRPFLNYVMTIYGHWPFDIDTARHSQTIEVTPPEEDLGKIATQMRLRTEALDSYVRELIEVDPKSIIVLVADHLPPLPGGMDDYARLGYGRGDAPSSATSEDHAYETFLLVLVDGKPVALPRMRHFDLPHWVLNELSHGAYCRSRPCDFGRMPIDRRRYLDVYQTILGLASQDVSEPLR